MGSTERTHRQPTIAFEDSSAPLWVVDRTSRGKPIRICKTFNTINQLDISGVFKSLSAPSVQSLTRVWLFETPWTAARQASLSITNSQSLLKLMSNESVMPSNHLILCHPLLLPPSIFPSTGVFSNESVLLMRWTNYWSFSFNISPSNEHPRLISFTMDWLDLLAVQGTLKSLLLHLEKTLLPLLASALISIEYMM